jgi:hypothetical protein
MEGRGLKLEARRPRIAFSIPDPPSSSLHPRAFWLILAAGLALRCYHYLRDPAMWHDEAALVLNVLDKSFRDLLGPLRFSEAAPPLFLWIERSVALVLGDGTYALRLVPFVASCIALITLLMVARRHFPPGAVVWLALLAGCSDRLLWHSCEAKPYATDVLVATSVLVLFAWDPAHFSRRRLALTIGLTPLLIFLSYPACFVLGGLALVLLPQVIRRRRARTTLLYGGFVGVLCGSFLVLLTGPIHAQRDDTLQQCWQDMFPPWEHPWLVPSWVVLRVSEVFRYACEPVGNVLVVVAVVGGAALWRGAQGRLAAFLLAPPGLAGIATLLGRYPLGATRVMVFAAPAVLLLIARGLPPSLAWLKRFGRLAPIALTGIVFFPVAQAAYRACHPWERADSARVAAFVREQRHQGEGVRGTNWEHDYYFRTLGADYSPLGSAGPKADSADRIWLVASGKTCEERNAWLSQVAPPGCWRVLDHAEFRLTTVYHLQAVNAASEKSSLFEPSYP